MTYRIYLVDDDKFLLDLYAVKFKSSGHDISTFNGGKELLADLRNGEGPGPDAILIDVIMPEIDGFETIEILRKEGLAKQSKIIFLSNQGQDSDFERAKELHADGYIVKASAIPSEVFTEAIRILEEAKPSM